MITLWSGKDDCVLQIDFVTQDGKLDRGKKSELPPQLTELTFLSALPSNNNPHTRQWFFSEQKNCYQKLFVKHAYDLLLKEEKKHHAQLQEARRPSIVSRELHSYFSGAE